MESTSGRIAPENCKAGASTWRASHAGPVGIAEPAMRARRLPGGGMATPGIFPTFFLSGFECSTFLWRDKGRRDLSAETQHDRHADADYRLLRELGIAVAREGIPWPRVDQGSGRYDFTCIDPLIAAMNGAQVLPIWDLCHYGYPDGADPWQP